MKERTRVLQLIPDLGVGGAEQMLLNLVCALDANRYEVLVLSLYPRRGTAIEADLDLAGIRSLYLRKRVGFDPRAIADLARAVRGFQPDVLHTHRSALAYAVPATLGRSVPMVHTIHNTADQEVPRWHRLVHRLAFHRGALPVAISSEMGRDFEALYGRPPAAVVTIGVPLERYAVPQVDRATWRAREGLAQDALVYVSVARFYPQKNVPGLVEAFARVAREQPNAVLLLVGDGPLRPHAAELATERGVQDRVRFLGLRRDIGDLLSASDVFALASSWEGTPVSIMEAMASGLPVVATSVGGVPDCVRHGVTGLLAAPGDTEGLVEAFRAMGADAARRAAMGRAGAAVARESLDAAAMARKYENLYDVALGRQIAGATPPE